MVRPKKTIYKTFHSEKELKKFIKTKVKKSERKYELRFVGKDSKVKKFRINPTAQKSKTIKKAFTYVDSYKSPKSYLKKKLKAIKKDSLVTVTVKTDSGKKYVRQIIFAEGLNGTEFDDNARIDGIIGNYDDLLKQYDTGTANIENIKIEQVENFGQKRKKKKTIKNVKKKKTIKKRKQIAKKISKK